MASQNDNTQLVKAAEVGDTAEVTDTEKTEGSSRTTKLRLINPSIDRRTISVEDFARHDVTVKSDYVWDRENDFTVSATAKAAKFLKTLHEFEEV